MIPAIAEPITVLGYTIHVPKLPESVAIVGMT
jgi:hypothetical protein